MQLVSGFANKMMPDLVKAKKQALWVIFAILINRLCNLLDKQAPQYYIYMQIQSQQ